MKRQSRIDPGVRCMLIFSGWVLLAACAALLVFGVSPVKLALLLLSLVLLIFFYRPRGRLFYRLRRSRSNSAMMSLS